VEQYCKQNSAEEKMIKSSNY